MENRSASKWVWRAVIIFFIWDFPQWIQAVFGLFTAEPLIPWLQKQDLNTPHFSPFWITGSVAVLLLCLFAWIDWNARKKPNPKSQSDKNSVVVAENAFFDVIAGQRSKLETMKYDEEIFFTQSVPVLSEAVHKTKRTFGDCRWQSLYQILKEYQSQDKGGFGKGRARMVAAFNGQKSHSERLNAWLDRFEDAAK